MSTEEKYVFARESWSGDSRDGIVINGDGYHYFKIEKPAFITEAYELYENEDGEEVVTPLPEMQQVDWMKDLGFDDLEALDMIEEYAFERIRNLNRSQHVT
ncbi:MAG: hypothetical protein AB8C84_10230 [Oligoflexales bacterium]